MGEILKILDINSVLMYSTALAIVLGMKLFSPIIARIIILIFHKAFKIKTKVTESGFYGPLKFIIAVIGFGISIYFLKLPIGVINLYKKIFKILAVIATAKALGNSLGANSTFFNKLESKTNFNGNEALNSFISKILKSIIYLIAAFIILKDFNIDLSGLIAGLGIGSAAIALAAQDFVKSIIGGFAIIADQTFEIGDFIEVGTFQGTVIDITFRSTKIKAANNTITSMPNSVIITEYVRNWSKLENRRLEMSLRISLNSSTETINRALSKLKTVLKNHENINSETVRVFLDRIDSDANIIGITTYMDTADYDEYLRIKEDINCKILEVLERENIELVYPTQKVYMKTIN